MATAVFAMVVISESFLGAGLAISLLWPSRRFWPPPRKYAWQQFYMLGWTSIATIGAIYLGSVDRGTFILTHPFGLIVGGSVAVIGLVFIFWGTRSLSIHISLGLEGELITTGAYNYSRNPQYIGWSLSFIGYSLACNSSLTVLAAGVGALLFGTTVFAEEPWLRERYGSKYDAYKVEVPRFFGLRRSIAR